MKNEPMYNAFVNNREQTGNRSSKSKSKRNRVKNNDLPEFDYDLEEPGTGDYVQGPAVGVDRTLGNFADYLHHDNEGQAPAACDGPITREPFEFEDGLCESASPRCLQFVSPRGPAQDHGMDRPRHSSPPR